MLDIIEDKDVEYDIKPEISISAFKPLDENGSNLIPTTIRYQLQALSIVSKLNVHSLYINSPTFHSSSDQQSKEENGLKTFVGWMYFDTKTKICESASNRKMKAIYKGTKKTVKKSCPYLLVYS